jgi:gliding motility-associated-like protein
MRYKTGYSGLVGLLWAFFSLLIPQTIQATHIIGGEIKYEQTGTNTYDVYVVVYRDCGPLNTLGTGFDTQSFLSVWNADDLSLVLQEESFVIDVTSVPNTNTNPCAVLPPELCVEKGEYYYSITIPGGNTDGLILAYQRCCFGNGVATNIMQQPGLTVYGFIPPVITNDSPVFNSVPPLGNCIYDDINLDLSASDTDGDSLVYSFVTPFTGASTFNPTAITPPPFSEMVWDFGYGADYPMDANPNLSIDSLTGLVSGIPNQLGYYIMTIKIEEFRAGIKIGEYIRTFRYLITDCELSTPLASIDVDQYCDDLEYQFVNSSANSVGFLWDFGDPGSGADNTSTLTNPTHTYPDYGTYWVTLIAYHDVLECSDTLTYPLEVVEGIPFTYTYEGEFCLQDNQYDFTASMQDTSFVYEWDFGNNALPPSSSEMNPQDVHFTTLGIHEVKLTIYFANCKRDYVDTVTIDQNLVSDVLGPEEICLYDIASFSTIPVFNYPRNYTWTIDDTEYTTENIQIQFEDTGTFDLRVYIFDPQQNCEQELFLEDRLRVYSLPTADFTLKNFDVPLNEEIAITDLSLNSLTTYWVISNGDTVFGEDPNYTFEFEGEYTIQQFSFDEHCDDEITKSIIVSPHNLVYPNAFSPNGDNLNDGFIPHGRVLDDMAFYHFEVYDRWGKLMFETNDPFEPWYGENLKGEEIDGGMYIWVAEYATHAFTEKLRNTVMLLK